MTHNERSSIIIPFSEIIVFEKNKKKDLHFFGRKSILFTSIFDASVAQLVELHLAKVVVEGSSPFARSIFPRGHSSVG